MDTALLCPDCGHAYEEPGEAGLGHRLRCLDCLIEIELMIELRMIAARPVAA